MSRIAKAPIIVPIGVGIFQKGRELTVKGLKDILSLNIHPSVNLIIEDNIITMLWDKEDKLATSQAGTARAIISNMVIGVTAGFEKKLLLVGVGYRAQANSGILNLTLGFSHPVEFQIPVGVTVETPTQTEILVKGSDKQQVGEVAAKIRSYRPPEPYKGKGVRYAEEHIIKKESKKK